MSGKRAVPERLLTYPQAAAYLGITVQALRDRVYKGQISTKYRLGRSVWFDPADLVRVLDTTRQGSSREG
jgi:predicted DNA-binding transcriptional regulator AlpA